MGAVGEVQAAESAELERYDFEAKEVLAAQWTSASNVEHRSGLWYEHRVHWHGEA